MDARSIKLACAIFSLLACGAFAADWPAAGERRTSFDAGWRFQLPVIVIHLLWLYFTMLPQLSLTTDCLIGIGPRPDSLRRMLSTGRLLTE